VRVRRRAAVERALTADVQDQLAEQRDTFSVPQDRGNAGAMRGARYSVRTETGANICSACGTPAGTQTARCAGTTYAASAVATRSTPLAAYVS